MKIKRTTLQADGQGAGWQITRGLIQCIQRTNEGGIKPCRTVSNF